LENWTEVLFLGTDEPGWRWTVSLMF